MIEPKRIWAAALAACLLAGPDPSRAEGARFDLAYEVYSGGFHALAVDMAVETGARDYDITAKFRTTGLLGWILPWSSVVRSEGELTTAGLEPRRHRMHGELRGRVRIVEIEYRAGQVETLRVEPAAREDDREEVSPAERRDASDPISAIFAVVRAVGEGGRCAARMAIFDGRRRYDLVASDAGPDTIAPSRYSSFGGEARRCDFVFQPIAGHLRRRADDDPARLRLQTGRAWLAPVAAGGPIAPVRIELDGNWGMTIAHLREAKRSAASAQPDLAVAAP
ncbi:MAG: DUF3108 domain-containing protein [Pseudomonadota bacterium]